MVRVPAVAGSFYPADAGALAALVDGLLDDVPPPAAPATATGYLVPHAGYTYSGSTAAHVYARLRGQPIDRVVLVGPAHFVLTRGCAVPAAQTWLTPLGPVPIDTAGARQLEAAGLATVDDRPHRPEHSLEVQLPFVQRVLGEVPVLPVAVGVSDVDAVARLLLAARSDERTVVLCSSDLSHYLDEPTATVRDEATLAAVCELAPQRVGLRDACGVYALRGLLGWARASGLTPRVLYRCTSAQTGGDAARVVGYAAVEFGGGTESDGGGAEATER
jgi:AmmeMemoRadiSam system protein B